MTGDDLIFLASQLIAQAQYGHAGARYRSAVSRAYYGAFHLVIDFLREFDVEIVKNHTGHVEAYRALFQTNHSMAVRAARMLEDLRGDRNVADYHLEKQTFDNPRNAMDRVEMAAEIKSCLNQCRREPDRSELSQHFDRA
jgi:uncharacterized protein (UPF0332 family)